jgi:hypothetical protein
MTGSANAGSRASGRRVHFGGEAAIEDYPYVMISLAVFSPFSACHAPVFDPDPVPGGLSVEEH